MAESKRHLAVPSIRFRLALVAKEMGPSYNVKYWAGIKFAKFSAIRSPSQLLVLNLLSQVS